jgi:hypothetical protein
LGPQFCLQQASAVMGPGERDPYVDGPRATRVFLMV